MKLKKVVAISMISAGVILALILLIGLLIPASVLQKIGNKSTPTTTFINSEGKEVVETINPATGEKIITTTDPNTGESVTITEASNGEPAPSSAQTPATPGSSTPGTTTTPPVTGGGSSTPAKPVVSISVSPSTITSGNSATLGWSGSNSPTSCAASAGWSGTKSANGSQSVTPTISTTYTLTCSNSGGSDTKSATLSVNAPAAGCGQPGGTCRLSDIQGYNTASNCRAAINSTGSGLSAYAITSSFLSLHQPKKTITNTLCGKVYSGNLRNAAGDHQNGSTLGGSNYTTWMNNLYLGPYN